MEKTTDTEATTAISQQTRHAQRMPQLNESAPDFEVKTTQGVCRLSDYAGRWLVLFAHPADFTPVCTTEFIAFARRHGEFKKLNCELLGLSIDSNYSHLAWTRNIQEKFGIEIPFPIIEDISMRVATDYGMIHPGASVTAAVRALFVIDDKGILRAMLYYPMSNGRSIDEVLRLVTALQTSDQYGIATPEGWHPGDKIIVPPPATTESAEKRLTEGFECVDWYFCKADLNAMTGKRAPQASAQATSQPMKH